MPSLLLYKTSPGRSRGITGCCMFCCRGKQDSLHLELILEIVEVDVGEVDVLLLGQFPVLAVPRLDLRDLGHLGALEG